MAVRKSRVLVNRDCEVMMLDSKQCPDCPWRERLEYGTGDMEEKVYCPVACGFPSKDSCLVMRPLLKLARAAQEFDNALSIDQDIYVGIYTFQAPKGAYSKFRKALDA